MCKQIKPLDSYGKHIRYVDGLRSACKECERNRARERRKSSPVRESKRLQDRVYGTRSTAEMTDVYIRKVIWHDSKGQIKAKDITQEMIKKRRFLLIEKRNSYRKNTPKCRVWFRVCRVCGKELPTHKKQTFCYDHRPYPHREKNSICQVCRKILPPGKSKFCSASCRRESFNHKNCAPYFWEWLFLEDRKANCFSCGREYVKHYPSQLFCNKSCATNIRNYVKQNSSLSIQDAFRIGIADAYKQFFLLRKELRNEGRQRFKSQ